MMVHNSKLKLQKDFKQMEKDIQTQKRIVKAKAEAAHRVKLMDEREQLIQDVCILYLKEERCLITNCDSCMNNRLRKRLLMHLFQQQKTRRSTKIC